MDTQMMVFLMMFGPLAAAITTAVNAKRINAAYRARREARRAPAK